MRQIKKRFVEIALFNTFEALYILSRNNMQIARIVKEMKEKTNQ